MYEVLVNRLFRLAQEKSVVGTDRADMTVAVDWDVKQQTKSLYAEPELKVASFQTHFLTKR